MDTKIRSDPNLLSWFGGESLSPELNLWGEFIKRALLDWPILLRELAALERRQKDWEARPSKSRSSSLSGHIRNKQTEITQLHDWFENPKPEPCNLEWVAHWFPEGDGLKEIIRETFRKDKKLFISKNRVYTLEGRRKRVIDLGMHNCGGRVITKPLDYK